ncbi:MAG: acyl-CoA desaturase, partial [Chitinophagales bacterium]|nr:acyl-CoA desaturase [Chitinophagales bacterium]
MVIVTVFIIHWYLAIFTHALFYHRYAAHGMWHMSKFWERVFYVLAFIVHGSSYLSANAYGIMHRLHHEHVDTEEDPHAPKYSGNILGFMVKTRNNYINIFHGKTALDAKYTENLPSWPAFEKFAHNWITRVAWIVLY